MRVAGQWKFQMGGVVEVTECAHHKAGLVDDNKIVGLAVWVKRLFKRHLGKSSDVRLSVWSCSDLSDKQIKYAALDAYAGLVVYS